MIGIITHISVLERTKEIGILRALGASKRNVSQVFNAETLLVGLCAGLLGVGISMAGLDAVSPNTQLVAVHDGARPLVSGDVLERTLHKAAKFGAAAPAIPVKDTIKVSRNGAVDDTPDRSRLYAVQTPQVFDFDLLRGAMQHAVERGDELTDDCSAVEALGMKVQLTQGSEENIKITTPLDLHLADLILKGRRKL